MILRWIRFFKGAYSDAINNLNQTGAFTFEIVNDSNQADIVATEMHNGSIPVVGEAESKTNL